jgi:hypothetical protein
VVIANLGTIDPWRLAHRIAADALEGDGRMAPAGDAIRQAEIEPIAGTWFNAGEPSLFDLAWKNGEATVTQNGLPFVLGRRGGGWVGAERGSFEFMLTPGNDGLKVDLGAGRVLAFSKLGERKAVPPEIAGSYASADSGAVWRIARSGDGYALAVGGPLIAGGASWTVAGVDSETVEITGTGGWLQTTQLARLVRDAAGKAVALEVSTGRIKNMRFERTSD